jgi:hypothetical protein
MSWGVYRPRVWINRPSQPRDLAAFTSPFVIWNPSDKNANVTLSNNNLTATLSAAVNNVAVRANKSSSAGYFEITFSTLVTGQPAGCCVGLANLSQSLATFVGDAGSNSVGYGNTGIILFNYTGTLIAGGLPTFAASDVLGVELTSTPSIKFYKNGTLVYTYAGTMPTGSLFPIVSFGNNTDSQTANFGASAMSYLPAGVTSWDGTQIGGVGSVAASSGVGTATAVGQWLQNGVASSAGSNTSAVTATWKQEGVAASAGANTSTVTATWKQEGVAASVGANTSAATATWKQEGVASSAGANTSAVTATWKQEGVAASAGTNTSSAVSAPIQSMVASSVGSNTAAAVGSWLQSGVASSAGANTASVTAKWLQDGVANSTGTNTSSAYSAALPGVATSSGANTASAVGQWTQAGVASSAGANTASVTAQWGQAGVASSIGANTAIAVGSSAAIAAGAASSVGVNVSAVVGRWVQAGVATSATKELSDLLMETSGNLLMEDGFKILLDEGSDVTVRTNVIGAWTAAISLDFNQDFSNDFGVSGVGSTLLDFNRDFSNDFAVYRIGARNIVSGTAVSVGSSIVSIVGAGGQAASLDFNRDFSGDFAVFGVTGAGQGVAESAGSNIAAALVAGRLLRHLLSIQSPNRLSNNGFLLTSSRGSSSQGLIGSIEPLPNCVECSL